MIISSITGPSMSVAINQMKASKRFADLFELRLDMIRRPDVGRLIENAGKQVIVACRPGWEGGRFRGSESRRFKILESACMLEAGYVDVELRSDPGILKQFLLHQTGTRVIVSCHLNDRTPRNVRALYHRMRNCGAGVVKLAYLAADASDIQYAVEFLRLAAADGQRAVAMAMGEAGEASRILYRKFGSWATYAAPETGPASAPGQLRASTLRGLYRADRLTKSTQVFGVIGNPLGQSKGVDIHNPLFERAGADAVYCKFPVKNLAAFMRHVAGHLSGFSVTIPYKQRIMQFLHRTDARSSAIGAVNTVVRRNGKLEGMNTDAPAALDAIENIVKVKNKIILILGAGGVARAIAFEAKRRGANVLVANRTESRGRKLASHLGVRSIRLDSLFEIHYDIVANATPVGMVPNTGHSPLSKRFLRGKIVFDAVYNPPQTKLLLEAKRVGAKIVSGTAMYLNQAARQSELYTGVRPGKRAMKLALAKHR